MLYCRMTDGTERRAEIGWSFLWTPCTKSFVIKNLSGMTGLPNIHGLGSITVADRSAFMGYARQLAQQAGLDLLQGQDDRSLVCVFLARPLDQRQD